MVESPSERFFEILKEAKVELSEEQKAKAQALADAVGGDPIKYFAAISRELAGKIDNQIKASCEVLGQKLSEKYSLTKEILQNACAEAGIIKEAYRIWKEKNGSSIVGEWEKMRQEAFEEVLDLMEEVWTRNKKEIDELINKLKE